MLSNKPVQRPPLTANAKPTRVKTLREYRETKFTVESLRESILKNNDKRVYSKPTESAYHFALG